MGGDQRRVIRFDMASLGGPLGIDSADQVVVFHASGRKYEVWLVERGKIPQIFIYRGDERAVYAAIDLKE